MVSVIDSLLNTEEQIEVPVESGFPSRGFIGPIRARVLWNFMSSIDLAGPDFRDDVPQPYNKEQMQNGRYQYYYLKKEPAAQAAQVDPDNKYGPQLVWYFSVPTMEIINADTSNFQSSNVARSCRIMTLGSKYRHEFHLIALPAIVAAVAKQAGYDVPEYDLSELLVRGVIITPDVSRRLIGGVLDQNGKFEAPFYQEGELWAQRAELWAALGEEDPSKYTVNAVTTSGKPAKTNTEAEKLKRCLGIYLNPWLDKPLWGRFCMAADPRVGAATSSGNQLTLPAITEIYGSEAEAKKAAEKELADRGDEPVAKADRGNMPETPTGYDQGEWIAEITPFLSMPKKKAREVYDEEEYGVPFDEMWAWVEWEKSS